MSASSLFLVDGRLQPGGQFVGRYTSQLQRLLDGSFAPVSSADWKDKSFINSSTLRHLHLAGEYLADVPLSLPSLFVLKLQGSLHAAPNLTAYNSSHTERFAAMIQLQHVSFSAVIGGTFDASSLPPHDEKATHGFMALSILGGSNNAIRGVRAMSNNSDSIIGVNQSPHAEVGGCDVGGGDSLGVLHTRCIWTLATSHALVHDNHV